MTEAYKISLENALDKWKVDLMRYDNDCDTSYIDSLKIFYLNPEKSSERRKQLLYQFESTGINMDNVQRIEPTKYPKVADYTLKNNIISCDHIGMWQKAYDQNCDGALFFEDDIYFLKNWKVLVQNIINKYGRDNTNIIRFDPAPLISIEDMPDQTVGVYDVRALACVGGYYMSRDAIITALNIVKTNPWEWLTIEVLLDKIRTSYFEDTSYETSPRICIQNWFLGSKSALQEDDHMKKIRDVLCSGYLQRYHTRYNFDNETLSIVKNVLEEYKDSIHNEKVL